MPDRQFSLAAAGFTGTALLVLIGAIVRWWRADFAAFDVAIRLLLLATAVVACGFSYSRLRSAEPDHRIFWATLAILLPTLSVLALFSSQSTVLMPLVISIALCAAIAVRWVEDSLAFQGEETTGASVAHPPGKAVAAAESKPDFDIELAEELSRADEWLLRSTAGGQETITGCALLRFAPSQKEAVAHVTFWPAMASVPQVELFCDDEQVTVKPGPILSQGLRLLAHRRGDIGIPLVSACRFTLSCAGSATPDGEPIPAHGEDSVISSRTG